MEENHMLNFRGHLTGGESFVNLERSCGLNQL